MDWKTALKTQKCQVNDESPDVEQMPAMQAPSVTEIGIKMPSIGRGKFLKNYLT